MMSNAIKTTRLRPKGFPLRATATAGQAGGQAVDCHPSSRATRDKSVACHASRVVWRPSLGLSKRRPNGHTGGVLLTLNNLTLTARMAGRTLAYFGGNRWRRATSPLPRKGCQVPADFFGLCVANAPDPACDDYVIARLNELGIRHARLDFTYGDRDAFTERFLDRLLTDQFRVCLHLVQPREEARAMLRMSGAAERWRAFIGDMLDRYGSRVELIEIGATCNRRKWSGYSPAAFFCAWQIAWEEARGRNLAIAGPNVTDFEPAYNAGWLGEFRRAGLLPSVHTDNLFVERATEPEAFDHRIAGQRLAGLLRFNLVRKAQLLQDIGAWAGVPTLMCAHVTWSLRRIDRFLEDVEEKQADYLGRYACLAAASGALARVYWGPLIGQREGLIDDGTSEYPEIPHVTYYEQARGAIKDYRLRPAFRTFQTVNRLLAGATFQRRLATGPGLEILEFELKAEGIRQDGEERSQRSEVRGQVEEVGGQKSESAPRYTLHAPRLLHAVWTTDGNGASVDACYPPELLAQADIYSRDGQRLERAPRMFSESPVFLMWPNQTTEDGRRTTDPASRVVRNLIPGVRFASIPGQTFTPIRHADWTGYSLAEDSGSTFDMTMLPAMLSDPRNASSTSGQDRPPSTVILRDSRNRVWSVPSPKERDRRLVIKQFNPRGFWKRLIQRHHLDRAQRSWNGSQELLRRGIPTPQPIAFIRAARLPAVRPSFYVCRAFENAWPARDAFTAFSAGATEFQGQAADDWYGAIAVFLQKLHTRGVYFRDLSAGNLLFRRAPTGELEFALIDTARARFYPHSLGLRLRLCDLMRICHPLFWPGRRVFVEKY
ncbi:MAG: lipopolysaccharide kinase InaA family protein, partial [Kiritimatiellota bacterium]|nr:lipopolysaccharide kinase InaA family protein [Kiritimatiellota bacterium]